MSHAASLAPPPVTGAKVGALGTILTIALPVEAVLGVTRLLGPYELGYGSRGGIASHIPTWLQFAANLYVYVPTALLGGQGTINVQPTQFGQSPQASQLSFRAVETMADLLRTVVVIGVTLILLRIARSLREGDPFTSANARRLGALVLLVGGVGQLAELLQALAFHIFETGSWFGGWSRAPIVINVRPIVYGLGLAVVAAVFRHGTSLRAEVDGLV